MTSIYRYIAPSFEVLWLRREAEECQYNYNIAPWAELREAWQEYIDLEESRQKCEWHDAKKELPHWTRYGEKFLVNIRYRCGDHRYHLATFNRYSFQGQITPTCRVSARNWNIWSSKVTHWAEIPEVPKT